MRQTILEELRQAGVAIYEWSPLWPTTKQSEELAQVVLPVAARWINSIDDCGMRHELYTFFLAKPAAPWMTDIIGWFHREDDTVAKGTLARIMAQVFREQDVPSLLTICEQEPDLHFRSLLLASLTKSKVHGETAIRMILRECEDAPYWHYLDDYAKVKDKRVQEVVAALKPRLPKQVVMPGWTKKGKRGPDLALEIWSTEVPTADWSDALKQVAQHADLVDWLDLKYPLPYKYPPEEKHLDRWFHTILIAKSCNLVELWARYEDVDVIELVVTWQ